VYTGAEGVPHGRVAVLFQSTNNHSFQAHIPHFYAEVLYLVATNSTTTLSLVWAEKHEKPKWWPEQL